MLKQVLVIICPKCGRSYTEQQLKSTFIDGKNITFKCQESNGDGCGSVIQANFYMKPEMQKQFSWKKLKKVNVEINKVLDVKVFLRT